MIEYFIIILNKICYLILKDSKNIELPRRVDDGDSQTKKKI